MNTQLSVYHIWRPSFQLVVEVVVAAAAVAVAVVEVAVIVAVPVVVVVAVAEVEVEVVAFFGWVNFYILICLKAE